MTLSIIIVNYNTFELTCNCIRSILETAQIEYEIILIDNHSRDEAPERFLALFPSIKLCALEKNVGFGRANNIGVEKACGKYVLLLNSDTIVHPRTLDETVMYLEEHHQVDILGCRVLLSDNTIQPTVFPYNGEHSLLRTAVVFAKRNAIIKEILKPIHRLLYRKSHEHQGNSTLVDSKEQITPNIYAGKRIGELAGVFLLMKRSVYLQTKGFDPDFFMYYEELEWFINRLRDRTMVYYPNASITHFYGKSDVYGTMSLNSYLSNYLFWYKISYFHFILFFLYNLVEIPSRLIIGLVQRNNAYLQSVSIIVKALPYALFEIPRYPNKYGARDHMLQTKSMKASQQ